MFTDSIGTIWTHDIKGIIIPSDTKYNITDCTLQQVPCDEPYFGIVNFSMSDNSKLLAVKIIGVINIHMII